MLKSFDHINMTVSNLDESLEWYGKFFDFKEIESGETSFGRWKILRSADSMLCLYERPGFSFESASEQRAKGRHAISHIGFRITDYDEFAKRVEAFNPVQPYEKIAYPHSDSWYLEDPTGHVLEVSFWRNGVDFGS